MDIKEFFKKDRFAEASGIEIVEVKKGYAKAQMRIEEKHINAAGTTQGGAIFTLADLVAAVAANTRGLAATSTHSTIHFFKGSRKGDILYAEAKERFLHRRMSVYQVEITNQEHELIALFDGDMYRKEQELPFSIE